MLDNDSIFTQLADFLTDQQDEEAYFYETDKEEEELLTKLMRMLDGDMSSSPALRDPSVIELFGEIHNCELFYGKRLTADCIIGQDLVHNQTYDKLHNSLLLELENKPFGETKVLDIREDSHEESSDIFSPCRLLFSSPAQV